MEKIWEWLTTFASTENIDLFLFSDRKNQLSSLFGTYAFYSGHNKFGFNTTSYQAFKDDESTIMYLAAHEVGHKFDKRFWRDSAFYKKAFYWSFGFILSIVCMIISIPINNIFLSIIWMGDVILFGSVLFAVNVYLFEQEYFAEDFAMKLVGPAIVLQGHLVLLGEHNSLAEGDICKIVSRSLKNALDEMNIDLT
jgi:hypothetical protein